MNPTNTISLDEIATIIVDCSYKLHLAAGPGLLESVYEAALTKMLQDRGLNAQRQVPIPIHLMGLTLDEGFRADILVNNSFIIELKSVEKLAPVHSKQLLTYLRLHKSSLGLLINFGAHRIKEGIKRIANNHHPATP